MPTPAQTLPIGKLTTAGTFSIHGKETTGFIVSCTRDEIQALPNLPLYQRVVIMPAEMVDGYTVRARDYGQLAIAARDLRAACRHVLPPGSYAQMDRECSAIDAILGPEHTGRENTNAFDTMTADPKLKTARQEVARMQANCDRALADREWREASHWAYELKRAATELECAIDQHAPVETDESRHHWHIELVPAIEADGGVTKSFTGTRKEAEVQADRLADAADFEVARCVLHRRGPAPS